MKRRCESLPGRRGMASTRRMSGLAAITPSVPSNTSASTAACGQARLMERIKGVASSTSPMRCVVTTSTLPGAFMCISACPDRRRSGSLETPARPAQQHVPAPQHDVDLDTLPRPRAGDEQRVQHRKENADAELATEPEEQDRDAQGAAVLVEVLVA